MFETKNSNGSGGYFDGFAPDVVSSDIAFEKANYDMWDLNDPSLSEAVKFIKTGTISSTRVSSSLNSVLSATSGRGLQDNSFKGMIETRFRVK
jgi:carboxyl-terminal processing protease